MPTVRKLSDDEVRTIENKVKGLRKLIEEEYDIFVRDYEVGDYGEAELNSEEKRLTVRNRLKAAAKRRGLSIDFKRTQGNVLRFKVGPAQEEAPPPPPPPTKGKGRGRKKAS
jgi:hypothetical protein